MGAMLQIENINKSAAVSHTIVLPLLIHVRKEWKDNRRRKEVGQLWETVHTNLFCEFLFNLEAECTRNTDVTAEDGVK